MPFSKCYCKSAVNHDSLDQHCSKTFNFQHRLLIDSMWSERDKTLFRSDLCTNKNCAAIYRGRTCSVSDRQEARCGVQGLLFLKCLLYILIVCEFTDPEMDIWFLSVFNAVRLCRK